MLVPVATLFDSSLTLLCVLLVYKMVDSNTLVVAIFGFLVVAFLSLMVAVFGCLMVAIFRSLVVAIFMCTVGRLYGIELRTWTY